MNGFVAAGVAVPVLAAPPHGRAKAVGPVMFASMDQLLPSVTSKKRAQLAAAAAGSRTSGGARQVAPAAGASPSPTSVAPSVAGTLPSSQPMMLQTSASAMSMPMLTLQVTAAPPATPTTTEHPTATAASQFVLTIPGASPLMSVLPPSGR
ncbi:PREDICTED: uncharacterized protein LOC106813938 [Priapulus caudatus]|uniref:Uncharacterized protein LOC106813938 n=1 Tax=Priapulus caudatus TaxID=37621 RepID=A0ABM1ENA0_PRICU|nr:PREDICTED: uncharacterized protein LOC106813938 [Priapulus caudatus]